MTHQPILVSVLLVLVIIALGIWIVSAIVDERKLRLVLSIAWVLVVALAAFGILR